MTSGIRKTNCATKVRSRVGMQLKQQTTSKQEARRDEQGAIFEHLGCEGLSQTSCFHFPSSAATLHCAHCAACSSSGLWKATLEGSHLGPCWSVSCPSPSHNGLTTTLRSMAQIRWRPSRVGPITWGGRFLAPNIR